MLFYSFLFFSSQEIIKVEELNQTFAVLETPGFYVIEEDHRDGCNVFKRQDFLYRFENVPVEVGFDEKKRRPIITTKP